MTTVPGSIPSVDRSGPDVRAFLTGPQSRFAIAVDAPDAVLTYGDLRSQAEQLSGVLRQLGVGPGDRVALCAPRSAALVVGAVAVTAVGACYVALDPAHPPARLAQLAAKAGVTQVVMSSALPVDLPQLGHEVTRILIDADAGECVCAPVSPPVPAIRVTAPAPGPADPAYVVFTSGSTGVPKAVVVSHAGLSNLIAWHHRAFELTKADRTTLIASPAFDASMWEMWPTLAAGASLHVPPDELRTDPAGLRDWLVERAVTVSFVPTAVTEQLLTLTWPRQAALRVLLTGGDVLHRRPRPGLPFQLVNNYGVSEASVVSTSGVVAPVGDESGSAPAIGAAIDGVTLAVVDDRLRPVGEGEPGELLIGGVSVALSYLDEPELTARAFVPADLPGAGERRWYRSGDLVRRRSDGVYEHLGRLDEQVQVRGSRVELGEVAAAFDRHPQVSASVVVARGEGALQRLVAYVVSPDGGEPERAMLAAHVSSELPAHMVPSAIVALPAMPVTANGKIDRAALPDPAPGDRVLRSWEWSPAGDHAAAAHASGRTPEELPEADAGLVAVVAALVCELLQLPAVDSADNFFLLGGHSMLGAQLIARLGELFAVELPLRDIFQNPTVAGISARVEQAMIADLEVLSDEEAERLANALPSA